MRSCNKTMPWMNASGRGGQPGTYTSTGMIWSTPFVTEYESQYGPPQLAHEPIEITYFGSGICSYRRLIAGAILSVTVPLITMRSDWRGLAGEGGATTRTHSEPGPASGAP